MYTFHLLKTFYLVLFTAYMTFIQYVVYFKCPVVSHLTIFSSIFWKQGMHKMTSDLKIAVATSTMPRSYIEPFWKSIKIESIIVYNFCWKFLRVKRFFGFFGSIAGLCLLHFVNELCIFFYLRRSQKS